MKGIVDNEFEYNLYVDKHASKQIPEIPTILNKTQPLNFEVRTQAKTMRGDLY